MMRRLLAVAVLAVAASAVPASASYLLSTGCDEGDWQVIEVSSGGQEYVEVCSSEDPRDYTPDIKCFRPVTC